MRKPEQFNDFPPALVALARFGPYRAAVSRVTDGDTFYALVDQGMNEYGYHAIRIADINAPELFSGTERILGAASRDFLSILIPPGTQVVLDTRKAQTFGRYVARVTLPDGTDVGERMVAAGMATRVIGVG